VSSILCVFLRLPVPIILYYTDKISLGWGWVGSLRQSTRVCPGYFLNLGGLVGFDDDDLRVITLFIRPRIFSVLSAKGYGSLWIQLVSHFASAVSLASSFSQFLLQALRHFLPLVFHTAMMCISQVCLGRGVCILFQKGTSAEWNWCDGMKPKNLHLCDYKCSLAIILLTDGFICNLYGYLYYKPDLVGATTNTLQIFTVITYAA